MDNDEKDKEILKSEIAYQCERSPKHQSEVEYLKIYLRKGIKIWKMMNNTTEMFINKTIL